MFAKDIMTTAVVTVSEKASVDEAVKKMLDHHVSALPVVGDESKLVGLISEGDLLRRLQDSDRPRRSWWLELINSPETSAQDYIRARSQRIGDVMTRDVISVGENTPVSEIAGMLEKRRIKRVPVLRDGTVVGIVSRANLVHALAAASDGRLPQPSASDAELRKAVALAIEEVPGAAVNLINFTVENGSVAVWGMADSDFVENAVRVAVENVPGVRHIDVHMGRLPSWGYGI